MKHSTMAVALILCYAAVGAAWARGAATTDQDFKILERKVARLEKDARDLTKTVRALDKALVTASKEAVAVGKAVKALDDRSNKRELLLADWLDKYHPKSDGRFHRGAIRRIK